MYFNGYGLSFVLGVGGFMSTIKATREYVFSTYVKNKYDRSKDALVVKEIIHREGLPPKRNVRILENYKRPYWITKPQFRLHKDKKEFEQVEKLDKYYSPQIDLPNNIFQKLNGHRPNRNMQLKEVCSSPYVYGTDISPNDLLKLDYVNKWGKSFTRSSVAVMDYEWSVTDKKGAIIAGIVSMKETVHIAIAKDWLGDLAPYAVEKTKAICNLHHGELIKTRGINLTVTVHDTPGKLVVALMKTVHALKPDFLAFWSIHGDITHMLDALEADGISPEVVFSDPSVPNEYQYFEFNVDPPFKIKANGEQQSKAPSERWHTVYAPSSFYPICAMSTFRAIRAREQQRTGYDLDSVLKDLLQLGKMKFDSVPSNVTGARWHAVMQAQHKLEYLAYLFGDGVFVEMLDEHTKDLCETLRPQVDTSSFDKFKSNTRRLVTDLHIVNEAEGLIIGSTGKNMVTKLDALIPSTRGWIVTLASELEEGLGVCVIDEYPYMATNISVKTSDIDLTGAYPSGGIQANVSRETNVFVRTSVQGQTETQIREWGINMTSVISNPVSLGITCYGMPDLDLFYAEFEKDMCNINCQQQHSEHNVSSNTYVH